MKTEIDHLLGAVHTITQFLKTRSPHLGEVSTTVLLAAALALLTVRAEGSGLEVLKRFYATEDFNYPDGGPPSGLIEATDGKLYGTTHDFSGHSTLFTMNKDGSGFAVMRYFYTYALASHPNGVIEGNDGKLYGTTQSSETGAGVVFRIDKDGTGYEVLSDGGSHAPLLQASDGKLYGTAGSSVFRLTLADSPAASYELLHSFTEPTMSPRAAVIEGSDGRLYGTTLGGAVFGMNKNGSGVVVLRTGLTSAGLQAPLIEGSDGKLYGMTGIGNTTIPGTVFSLNKDGTGFAVLKSFLESDGSPVGALVEGRDGLLYGMTSYGGSSGFGNIFSLNKNGDSHTVVHNFVGGPDEAAYPVRVLLQASDGKLYGATQAENIFEAAGVLFRLNISQPPCPNPDAIIWHQPLARHGASEDTDPSAGRTVKYRFKRGSTIPIKIHALDCAGADVTSNANVIGQVTVFGDSNCDGAIDDSAVPIDFNGVGGGGGVMDKIGAHLKYNLDTKSLPTTTQCYILRVTVTDTSTGEEKFEEVLLQAK